MRSSLIVCSFVLSVAGVAAQSSPVQPPQAVAPAPAGQPAAERVVVTAGRSTVLATQGDVTRIAITDPTIADAVVVEPREILIDGKKAGTISLIVWSGSSRKNYDIVVEPAITTLEQHLQALFPGEPIEVSVSEEAVILSGLVSSTSVMLRAAEIARASSSKSQIINMLQVPGGSESQQVMLQVRFAEVNRRAVKEVGLALFAQRENFSARSTTQQFAAPDFDDSRPGGLVFTDYLNLFFFDREHGIGGVLKALEQSGGFQSLAEPNLIAYNGQEASFLAGGEFPVPIVQGNTGSVSVEFKEFGIRLSFTPTIAGDVIRLKVRPEVSTLDFANGITLSGFRIPALTTRRAQTDVELRDGQSFAIAGLLDNVSQNDSAAIPILSKLPIIGNLFKSKADRAERTELMVLITPRLVRALNPDEVPPLPVDMRPFIPKGGGVGQQLEGAGGLSDAPAMTNTSQDKKQPPKPAGGKGYDD
ncbi:MAG TPA: type II and III secretion system protein family protein [Vicinamibacterales bacterium]|nr:type II and III secretion system protein family protein [Vicinamibacterales bacterium]